MDISTGARNVIANGVFNEGSGTSFGGGTLAILSGSAPADADAAETGTTLASITLPADAFSSAVSGVVSKSGTWEDASADATGTAGYWRAYQSGDGGSASTTAIRLQGSVSASGGGGELQLSPSLTVTATESFTVTSFTFTVPAS